MIQTLARLTKHRAAIFNMAMLYAGKTSGVLVALFFLPLYSRLLGAEQFGIVAVILSLQALLVMMDLGMSTLVSRDIAAGESSPTELVKLIRTAEISLSGFYFLLLAGTAAIKAIGGLSGVDTVSALAAVTLFWLLVLQNVYYSAMLARRTYIAGTIIQVIGVIVRALASWYFLLNFSATLFVFILTQLTVSVVHCLICRVYLLSLMQSRVSTPGARWKSILGDCFSLVGRGRAILISGAVGAAAMQLDKPIISFFRSAADITPYFFAVTLSSAPVALLAGPIVQYFQPRIIADISRKDSISYRRNMVSLTVSFAILTIVPLAVLFVLNDSIVDLWLGPSAQSDLVSSYSRILLMGYGIATAGYIPYVVIIAKQDYGFQAKLSVFATVFVLIATAISAYASSMVLVCYSYVVYFAIATIGFYIRVALNRNSPATVV